MKKLLASALCFALVIPFVGCNQNPENSDASGETSAVVTTEAPAIEGYNLLWHDEFDGDQLNLDIWTREVREPGWTNNELQEYRDSEENAYVKDGCLVLQAIKTKTESGADYYTSGKVNSQNKADFMYGKVIIRAKVPEGQGLWPAGWMMPTDEQHYGQWPTCGEIDIFETLGHITNTAHQTVHYGKPHGQQQGTKVLDNGKFSDDFHDYSVEWEPGEMRFYIDDELILTVNDWNSSADGVTDFDYPAPFNQTFFVQLNLAVGGDWPGNPDETTNFDNAKLLVDYVRVYQKPEYDTNVTKPVFDARVADETGNFITTGDFSDSSIDLTADTGWNFLLFENGAGAAEIKDNMIEITTQAAGDVDYSVQLVFWDVPLETGKKYKVTYDAKASENRNMVVCVSAPFADWIRYYPDTAVDLTTDWQTYTFEFDMTQKTDNRGRLEFNMGNRGSTATIDITNVRFEEIS